MLQAEKYLDLYKYFIVYKTSLISQQRIRDQYNDIDMISMSLSEITKMRMIMMMRMRRLLSILDDSD